MHPYHITFGSVSETDTLLFSLPFREVQRYSTNSHQIMAQPEYKAGKKAGVITYKVGDDYLVREYNPRPANPRTEKQVQQRAKIKLLSQVAALFRFIIAIFPTSGKSARSLFLTLNWQNIYFSSGQAQISLENIDITATNTPITDISYQLRYVWEIAKAFVYFPDEPPDNIQRVFYYLFKRIDNNCLELLDYTCTENRGAPSIYQYFAWRCDAIELDEQGHTTEDYYVYAFGMIDKSTEATEKWDDNTFQPMEHLAPQIKLGLITPDLYEFTQTKYLFIPKGT